jgi:nucleoside phosphorylase
MGNNAAANRASSLLERFPGIEAVLMVGIAGGIPNPAKPDEHVRLGDIVVSAERGVIQYDFVKDEARELLPRHPPRPPGAALIDAVRMLEAHEYVRLRPWLTHLRTGLQRLRMRRPPARTDVLVDLRRSRTPFRHPTDPKRRAGCPRVFIAPIASANVLLKNAARRDALRASFGVRAVEMEGSGIADAAWDHLIGYLVIRGICDYCDDTKNDTWQEYAALAAASYARALIESLPTRPHIEETSSSVKGRSRRDTPKRVGQSLDYASLLVQGVDALPTDYAARIRHFLLEYLGAPQRPVPFGGRQFELAQLDGWLESPNGPPYVLITARAGGGKSALLAQWSARLAIDRKYSVVFVPVSIRFRTNLAAVVFPVLTARLAELHGEQLPSARDMTIDAWRGLVSTYLLRGFANHRTLVVIIDGLDEAADWELGPDVLPATGIPHLRVIVSAREEPGDAPWMKRLGWPPTIATHLPLHPLTRGGVRDVLHPLRLFDFASEPHDTIVDELYRLSEGDPLLLRLYVDDLTGHGGIQIRLTMNDLASLPSGLTGYFDRWWEDQRRQWGTESANREQAVGTLLSLFSCALGPLTRDELLAIYPELSLNSRRLDTNLWILRRFLIGDGGRLGYVFSHPRLAQYFYEHLSRAEHLAVEHKFVAFGLETLRRLASSELHPAEASRYVVQYLGAHLARAGAPSRDFYRLVSKGWLNAWQVMDKTHSGFLADVARAWTKAEEERDIGMQVRAALCHASVAALGRVPADLLHLGLQCGVLTTWEALELAREMPTRERAAAMSAIAQYGDSRLGGVILSDLRKLSDPILRVSALLRLAKAIEEPLRTEAIQLGVECATEQIGPRRDDTCAVASLGLAELGLTDQAEELAHRVQGREAFVRLLGDLIPHMPARQCSRLSEHLENRTRDSHVTLDLVRAAARLTIRLEPRDRQRFLEYVRALICQLTGSEFWPAVSACIELFDAEYTRRTLDDALENMTAPGADNAALACLGHLFALGQHVDAISAARAVFDGRDAQTIEHAVRQCIATSGPRVAWDLTSHIMDVRVRIRLQAELLRVLPPDHPAVHQLLHEDLTSLDPQTRVDVCLSVAPSVPDADQQRLLHQAFGTARTIAAAEPRVRALLRIATAVAAPVREDVLNEASMIAYRMNPPGQDALLRAVATSAAELRTPRLSLECLEHIRSPEQRALTVRDIAAHFQEPLFSTVLKSEMARISALTDRRLRIRCNMAIADCAQGDLRAHAIRSAIDAAREIGDRYYRDPTLAQLALSLAEAGLTRDALNAIEDITDHVAQLRCLGLVLPHADGEALLETTNIALRILREMDEGYQPALVRELIPRLLEKGQSDAVLTFAAAVAWPEERAALLIEVESDLPSPVRERALIEAFEAAKIVAHPTPQGELLRRLATLQSPSQNPVRVYLESQRLGEPGNHEGLLHPYLLPGTWREALFAARHMDSDSDAVDILLRFVDRSSRRRSLGALLYAFKTHAIHLAAESTTSTAFTRLTDALLERIGGHGLRRFVERRAAEDGVKRIVTRRIAASGDGHNALLMARGIVEPYLRLSALVDLIPVIDGQQRHEIYEEVFAPLTSSLICRDSETDHVDSLPSQLAVEGDSLLARLSIAVAERGAFEDAARALMAISAAEVKADAFGRIAVLASRNGNVDILRQWALAVDQWPRSDSRDNILNVLARQLASQKDVISAISTARKITALASRATCLAAIAEGLDRIKQRALLDEALAFARAVSEFTRRDRTITTLVRDLVRLDYPADALSAAREIQAADERAQSLLLIHDVLPSDERVRVLREVLVIASTQRLDSTRRDVSLRRIAISFAELGFLSEAREAAKEIGNLVDRASTFGSIATLAPENVRSELLHEVVARALRYTDVRETARVVTALGQTVAWDYVKQAIQDDFYNDWLKNLRRLSRQPRPQFLADLEALMPIALILGGSEGIREIARAVLEVFEWWR